MYFIFYSFTYPGTNNTKILNSLILDILYCNQCTNLDVTYLFINCESLKLCKECKTSWRLYFHFCKNSDSSNRNIQKKIVYIGNYMALCFAFTNSLMPKVWLLSPMSLESNKINKLISVHYKRIINKYFQMSKN